MYYIIILNLKCVKYTVYKNGRKMPMSQNDIKTTRITIHLLQKIYYDKIKIREI